MNIETLKKAAHSFDTMEAWQDYTLELIRLKIKNKEGKEAWQQIATLLEPKKRRSKIDPYKIATEYWRGGEATPKTLFNNKPAPKSKKQPSQIYHVALADGTSFTLTSYFGEDAAVRAARALWLSKQTNTKWIWVNTPQGQKKIRDINVPKMQSVSIIQDAGQKLAA